MVRYGYRFWISPGQEESILRNVEHRSWLLAINFFSTTCRCAGKVNGRGFIPWLDFVQFWF